MAISNTTSGSVQQWLNQWLPQITREETTTAETDAQTSASAVSDTVSLSSKAEKLSRIHQEFFAAGPISSDQIRNLSVRMYEEGLLNAEDVSRLTGETVPQGGNVKQAMQFLANFIAEESVAGDVEGAKELNKALQVLSRADQTVDENSLAEEQSSAAYVTAYRDLLVETDADSDLIEGFDQVVDVFQALDQVRANTAGNSRLAYSALLEKLNKG